MEHEPVILFGQHQLAIDEKSRLLIPSVLRQCLARIAKRVSGYIEGKPGSVYVKVGSGVGSGGRLCIYPEATYESVVKDDPATISPTQSQEEFNLMHFAMAELLPIDGSGRIIVPPDLLKEAGLGKDVVLLGVKDHIQVWSPEAWQAEKARLRAGVRKSVDSSE
jgi:MraZ protein